jgi:hypothetical protein
LNQKFVLLLDAFDLAPPNMPEEAHVHQCRYIHTEREIERKRKRNNKIVVGYFDF